MAVRELMATPAVFLPEDRAALCAGRDRLAAWDADHLASRLL
jgi:hypothetical protein